ncbi:MAG: DNA-protecting protein DprA [Lewinellaceae bacterium]|nr:DNA-protecting protein DprA [Lewinellaceae bacterium]
MEELLYKIAITLIPNVGPVTTRNLVSYCGGVKAVFEARKRELLKVPGVGPLIADNIVNQDVLGRAEEEWRFIEDNSIQALFYLDDDYPGRLRHYPDSPAMLYYKGQADLNGERIVAIVGTRRPSVHGVHTCEELVEGLKRYGATIISGLAYGIDITAHRKCLSLDIPTVGVLGHGLRRIYPPQHRQVARAMLQSGGLLTEYPSHTLPDREHFPMRNRIIAGLCDALIVVETQKKGGSMISAHMANDYNKDVFAVPGRIKDGTSEGCNHLIKTHKAALIENADDVAYILRWEEPGTPRAIQKQLFVELTEAEKIVVDLLNQYEAIDIDQLTGRLKMANSEMASLLLELEFKGVVRALPGKRYVLA